MSTTEPTPDSFTVSTTDEPTLFRVDFNGSKIGQVIHDRYQGWLVIGSTGRLTGETFVSRSEAVFALVAAHIEAVR